MAYKIKILDRAQEEINDAYLYYSKFSFSALKHFDDELDEVYSLLEQNPKFQIRYKNLRALPFKTLPYLVFFLIDENEKIVRIYSVFNTFQNPEKYP